jgi:hypothetical protein
VAVIKYQINGKADTKPIAQTQAAAEGFFKKIEAIDNKLKGFVGVKVFSEVSKAINNSLREYDAFKKSLGEESAFARQINSLRTTMAGTLGTVRDAFTESVGEALSAITGGDAMEALQTAIMKAGAGLAAGFEVASGIARNIAANFDAVFDAKRWDDFFSYAADLAVSFALLLARALGDAFVFGLKNLDNALKKGALLEMMQQYERMGKEVPKELSDLFAAKGVELVISDETRQAFEDFASKLGRAVKELGDNLVPDGDISALFRESYDAALARIQAIVAKMNAPGKDDKDDKGDGLSKAIKAAEKLIKELLSAATGGFNRASSSIGGILGDVTGRSADAIRTAMRGLDAQFNAAAKTAGQLQDQLQSAASEAEVAGIMDSFNSVVNRMNVLSGAMHNLEGPAERARLCFNLLQGALNAIGELGMIIQAVMSSNPIGLVILGITKLLDTLSGLKDGGESVAGVMDIVSSLFSVVSQVIGGLGPALSMIFMPILDIVSALGRVLGSLLNIIVPFVAMVVQLVSQFDILTPILNTIAVVLAIAADAFGTLYNTVSSFIRKLTFGLVNIGKMATDNLDRLYDSINQENSWQSSETSNNTANYNVAGDLHINIHYDRSYVNGDAREIALNIRNEIRAAEAAGY